MLRSALQGQQGLLTRHPLQNYPVMWKRLCCKMWYDPSNWHCSKLCRDWYLDTSPKPKDPSSHNMLSTTNIAKSDCFTNFKHSNKTNLTRWRLGLWWLVLRSAREGHHPLQIHPSPVMFFGKNKILSAVSSSRPSRLHPFIQKNMLQIWNGTWNWHCKAFPC